MKLSIPVVLRRRLKHTKHIRRIEIVNIINSTTTTTIAATTPAETAPPTTDIQFFSIIMIFIIHVHVHTYYYTSLNGNSKRAVPCNGSITE